MLNVYLLRHGETQWNADGNKYCGRTDLPLISNGIEQARELRQQLAGITFDAIYASPLQRAYSTAGIVCEDEKITLDERLIEVDFGEWEGKPKKQFIPENQALWDAWMADPATTQAGGTGETAQEVIDRVDAFYDDILQKYNEGTILVVAHNGVNRFYLAHKLGMPLSNYRKLIQENSLVTLFKLDEAGELSLHRLNSRY